MKSRVSVIAVIAILFLSGANRVYGQPVTASAPLPAQATYTLPAIWKGTAADSTAGNPLVMDGKPRWRLDRIWPDDPMQAANYVPMPWNGYQWRAKEHELGGQPSASIEGGGKFVLSGRGPWSGNESHKLPALVFIAPETGKYSISATVTADAWEGGGAHQLQILKRDRMKKTVTEAFALPVSPKMAPAPLNVANLFVEQGQEVVFLPRYPAFHQAGNVALEDLKIGFYSAAKVKDYVTVGDDGHLWLNGKRERFWGVISFVGNKPADNAAVAVRYRDMGFNLARVWVKQMDPAKPYVKGDGSPADLTDHLFAELGKQGIKVWCTSFNNRGKATPADVGIVNDPETAQAWSEAVKDGLELRGSVAAAWDPRLEALGIARMRQWANHVNQYTGKRWGDDPTIAIWELSNEEWWFGHMVGGDWQRLPAFFRNSLIARWNDWLKTRYGTDEKLKTAWRFLLPGESVETGTVLFAPMRDGSAPAALINDANPAARSAMAGMAQQYTRDDFTRKRGEDVIAFLLEIWITHKQREHNAVKTWGQSCQYAPLVWDTGIGYEIQAQFMHQHADAVAHDTYITGFHHDPTSRRYPWYSGLEELPRMCWDVPWVEQNRVEGKPYLIYETQIEQPAKYRAEYPMRIASLGAIQDWDAVCWHLFGQVPDANTPRPYDGWMDITTAGEHPQGYHFQRDEVQMSAMRAASEIFRNGLLPPAPNPTKFVFGRKSLMDPATMEYGRSYGELGKRMMPTTYRYGVRLQIDPTREDDAVIGPSYKPRIYEPNPIKPNPAIEYDWQKGHLKFDAPGVASYTGFFAQYGGPVKFTNGVTLRDVTVVNPPGIAYPVTPREKYVEFSLTSTDGLPLARTKRALLSCVSSSFNIGFELDLTKLKNEFGWFLNGGATKNRGGDKALVARVGATIEAPALSGMRYTLRDWHMKPIGTGTVTSGRFVLPANKPVFIVEFAR